MADGEDGGVEVHGQTTLLSVDERLARSVAQFSPQFSGTELARRHGAIDGREESVAFKHRCHGLAPVGPQAAVSSLTKRNEEELSGAVVLLGLQVESGAESPVLLALEGQRLAVVEHHLVDLGPLERRKDVILVGVHEFVGG